MDDAGDAGERQRPQVVLTTRITSGLDGVRKQSKSLGNFVPIDDGARKMFGKAMSLPDALAREWLEVYTILPPERIEEACAASPCGAVLRSDQDVELKAGVELRLRLGKRRFAHVLPEGEG